MKLSLLYFLIALNFLSIYKCHSQNLSAEQYLHLDSMIKNNNVNTIKLIDSLLLVDSCNVNLLNHKALYFENLNKNELALYFYFKVINMDKKNIYAFYNIAVIYYNSALSNYIEEEPLSIERYRYKIIKSENDFTLSKIFFEKVLELDPQNEIAIHKIKELETRTNCTDKLKI